MIRFSQTFYSHVTICLVPLALLLMTAYSFTPNVAHSGQPRLFFLAVGLAAAFSFLGWAQVELLIGLGHQAWVFLLLALNSCVMLGVLWLSLALGAGIWAFPFSTLAGAAAAYPIALGLIRRQEPSIQFFSLRVGPEFWTQLRRLWPDAWSCIRQQMFLLFLSTFDVVLVGLICSSEDAAIYAVLSRLIAMARSFLQSTGDAAWPLVAQQGQKDHAFETFFIRSNGWAIGSAVGALALTLGPFLALYMGLQWAPPRPLVLILTGRLLIMGLSSPADYLLQGFGEFKTIARYALREMAAAGTLGVLLGAAFGMMGVAVGFLASTAVGSFFPLFFAYGRSVQRPGGRVMWQAWWRGGLACAVSAGVAALLLPLARNPWQVFGAGAAAALAALACGVAICLVRFRSTRAPGTFRSRLREVMANI
jgi:O-antigen/teichoic acid export membrane protein